MDGGLRILSLGKYQLEDSNRGKYSDNVKMEEVLASYLPCSFSRTSWIESYLAEVDMFGHVSSLTLLEVSDLVVLRPLLG